MCISTVGCSAFQYEKENGDCYLGSKLNLQKSLSNQPSNQLTKITINKNTTVQGIF